MSQTSGGYGWWQASDGLWYPPELHADYRPVVPSLPALPPPGYVATYYSHGYPVYVYGGPPQRTTNGFAVASLICSLMCFCCIWLLSALALIFGIIALRQIKAHDQDGRGMAIAGTVLGAIEVCAVVGLIIFDAALSH